MDGLMFRLASTRAGADGADLAPVFDQLEVYDRAQVADARISRSGANTGLVSE